MRLDERGVLSDAGWRPRHRRPRPVDRRRDGRLDDERAVTRVMSGVRLGPIDEDLLLGRLSLAMDLQRDVRDDAADLLTAAVLACRRRRSHRRARGLVLELVVREGRGRGAADGQGRAGRGSCRW